MKKPFHACVSGPLRPYAPGYQEDLVAQGYSQWTIKVYLELMGYVSRSLAARQLMGADLDAGRITGLLTDRRASGQVRRLTPRGLQPLLRHLRILALAPDPAQEIPGGWEEEVLSGFTEYLDGGRGLSVRTLDG